MAEDSLESTKISRRNFLIRGTKAAIGGTLLLGGVNVGANVAAKFQGEIPAKAVELRPEDFGYDQSLDGRKQTIFVPKESDTRELLEIKKDWRKERVFNKQIDDLADIWTRHWMKANNLYSGDKDSDSKRFQINRELILGQAREVLLFANEMSKILDDPAVKNRLSAVASYNKLESKWKTTFSSPFFGQQELNNVRFTQVSRINLGLYAAIGLVEYTTRSNLYKRLIGGPDRLEWDYYDAPLSHYDAVNAHVGWNAGRYLSGQTDSSIEQYGLEDRGGIFANAILLRSIEVTDRAIVLLQPLILNLRAFNFPEKVGKDATGKDIWKYTADKIEVTDLNGHLTPGGKKLLSRYNRLDLWQRRFTAVYAGLEEFCQLHPGFKWLLTGSVV